MLNWYAYREIIGKEWRGVLQMNDADKSNDAAQEYCHYQNPFHIIYNITNNYIFSFVYYSGRSKVYLPVLILCTISIHEKTIPISAFRYSSVNSPILITG